MEDKKNDFIAALLKLNPTDFTTLYTNDVTPENTAIQEYDFYKDKKTFRDQFTDKTTGVFNEKAAKEYYNSSLRVWNAFANSSFEDAVISEFARNPYDWHLNDDRFTTGDVIIPKAYITTASDPNHRSQSVYGIGTIAEPKFSVKEIASSNNVHDENGNILDWTPEDGGFLDKLFRPAMAVAIYDQDTDEEVNGQIVHHKKGEPILDYKGDPYAEILGDKDYYGRDIITWQDNLTKEGTRLNDFNPFDADGLRQSAGGTVVKTMARLLPYFIPYARYVWGAIDIARETATALPAMAKAIDGIVTDNDDNQFGTAMTKWENYMQTLRPGLTEHGKHNFFNFENIGNIIADSGGQLMSQTMVAKIPGMLVKNPTLRSSQIGQNMALGYMALTSATDTYSQFKQAGASDRVAGLGAIGVASGMYALMSTNYFRRLFFEGTGLDEQREISENVVKPVVTLIKDASAFPEAAAKKSGESSLIENLNKWAADDKNGLQVLKKVYTATTKLINKRAKTVEPNLKTEEDIKKYVSSVLNAQHNETAKEAVGTYVHRALNEGYEEVVEEGMQDMMKGTALLAEHYGVNTTDDENVALDFGFTWKNVAERYLASFFGGAIGGATFNMYTRYDRNILNRKNYNVSAAPLVDQLLYYTQLGYGDYMKRLAKKMETKGLIGNKNLSAKFSVDTGSTKDVDNNIDSIFLGRSFLSGTKTDNQANTIYNSFANLIDSIEAIVKSDNLMIFPDSEFFKDATDDIKKQAQQLGIELKFDNSEEDNAKLKELEKNAGIDLRRTIARHLGIVGYGINEIRNLSRDIFRQEIKIKELGNEITSKYEDGESSKANAALADNELLKSFQNNLKDLKKQFNELIKGKHSDLYLGFGAFMMQNGLYGKYVGNDVFGADTVENYTYLATRGLHFKSMSPEEQAIMTKAYTEYTNTMHLDRERASYALHMDLANIMNRGILENYELNKNLVPDDSADTSIRGENAVYKTNALSNLTGTFPVIQKILSNSLTRPGFVNGMPIEEFQKMYDSLLNTNTEETGTVALPQETWDAVLKYYENAIAQNVYIKDSVPIQQALGILFGNIAKSNNIVNIIDNINDIDESIANWINNIATSNKSKESESVQKANCILGLLQRFYQDPFNFRRTFNEIIDEIKDAGNFTNPTNAINAFKIVAFGQIAIDGTLTLNEPAISFFDKWLELSDKLPKLNIKELLNTLSINTTGTSLPVFDLVTDNFNKFINSENFLVGDEIAAQLLQAQKLINVAEAIFLASAPSNLNSIINPIRKSEGLEEFAELPISAVNLYINELETYKNRIDYLLTINKDNQNLSNEAQKRVPINVIPKLLDFILEPVGDEKDNIIAKRLKENLKLEKSLIDIFNESTDNFDRSVPATEENINTWSKALIDFSDGFRDAVKNSEIWKIDQAEVGKAIANAFGEELIRQNVGTLSPNSQDGITMFTEYMWLQTIANIRMTDDGDETGFYSHFKNAIKTAKTSNGSDLIPFFGHEFDVMLAWGQLNAQKAFNAGLDTILTYEIADDNLSADQKDYLINRSKGYNIIYIDGKAGTGKSESVIRIICAMAGKIDGTQLFNNAVSEKRLKAINSIIGTDKNNSGLWNDVWNRITSQGIETAFTKTKTHATKLKNVSFDKTDNPLFDNEKGFRIMVIDEAPLLSEGYMEGMVKYAKANNVFILAAGDIRQNAYKTSDMKDSNIKDMALAGKTPSLEISLREAYLGKKNNNDVIRHVQDPAFKMWNEKPETPMLHLNEAIEIANKTMPKQTLVYLDSDEGFYGDLLVEDSEFESWIDKLIAKADLHNKTSKEKQTVAIVIDSEKSINKYAKYIDRENVSIVTAKDVQGDEYTYLAIDLEFTARNNSGIQQKRDLETMMTRARSGAIYNKYSDSDPLAQYEFIKSITANRIIKPSPTISTEYKAFRQAFYDSLNTSTPPPIAKPIQPKPKPTGGTKMEYKDHKVGSSGATKFNDQTLEGKSKEEIIDTFVKEKEGFAKSDNFDDLTPKDKERVRQFKQILDAKKENNFCDFEDICNYIHTDYDFGSQYSIFRGKGNEAKSEQETLLKYMIMAVLNKSKNNNETLFEALKSFANTAEYYQDGISNILESFLISLNNESTGKMYFVTKTNNSKDLLHYAFNYDGNWYVIPIAMISSSAGFNTNIAYQNIDFNTISGTSISSNGRYRMPLADLLNSNLVPNPKQLAILSATLEQDSSEKQGVVINTDVVKSANETVIDYIYRNNGKTYLFLNYLWSLHNNKAIENIYLPRTNDETNSITSLTNEDNIPHEVVQWTLTLEEAIRIAVLEDLVNYSRHSKSEVKTNQSLKESIINLLSNYFPKTSIEAIINSSNNDSKEQNDVNAKNNIIRDSMKILSDETSERLISSLYRYFILNPNDGLDTFQENFANLVWKNPYSSKNSENVYTSGISISLKGKNIDIPIELFVESTGENKYLIERSIGRFFYKTKRTEYKNTEITFNHKFNVESGLDFINVIAETLLNINNQFNDNKQIIKIFDVNNLADSLNWSELTNDDESIRNKAILEAIKNDNIRFGIKTHFHPKDTNKTDKLYTPFDFDLLLGLLKGICTPIGEDFKLGRDGNYQNLQTIVLNKIDKFLLEDSHFNYGIFANIAKSAGTFEANVPWKFVDLSSAEFLNNWDTQLTSDIVKIIAPVSIIVPETLKDFSQEGIPNGGNEILKAFNPVETSSKSIITTVNDCHIERTDDMIKDANDKTILIANEAWLTENLKDAELERLVAKANGDIETIQIKAVNLSKTHPSITINFNGSDEQFELNSIKNIPDFIINVSSEIFLEEVTEKLNKTKYQVNLTKDEKIVLRKNLDKFNDVNIYSINNDIYLYSKQAKILTKVKNGELKNRAKVLNNAKFIGGNIYYFDNKTLTCISPIESKSVPNIEYVKYNGENIALYDNSGNPLGTIKSNASEIFSIIGGPVSFTGNRVFENYNTNDGSTYYTFENEASINSDFLRSIVKTPNVFTENEASINSDFLRSIVKTPNVFTENESYTLNAINITNKTITVNDKTYELKDDTSIDWFGISNKLIVKNTDEALLITALKTKFNNDTVDKIGFKYNTSKDINSNIEELNRLFELNQVRLGKLYKVTKDSVSNSITINDSSTIELKAAHLLYNKTGENYLKYITMKSETSGKASSKIHNFLLSLPNGERSNWTFEERSSGVIKNSLRLVSGNMPAGSVETQNQSEIIRNEIESEEFALIPEGNESIKNKLITRIELCEKPDGPEKQKLLKINETEIDNTIIANINGTNMTYSDLKTIIRNNAMAKLSGKEITPIDLLLTSIFNKISKIKTDMQKITCKV